MIVRCQWENVPYPPHTESQLLCSPLFSFAPYSSLLVFSQCCPTPQDKNLIYLFQIPLVKIWFKQTWFHWCSISNPSSFSMFKSSSISSMMKKRIIITGVISITYLSSCDLDKTQKRSYDYIYFRNKFREGKQLARVVTGRERAGICA